MKCVEKNGEWIFMCFNECFGFVDCYGEEFEVLYEKYEKEGCGCKMIKVQKLWYVIFEV